MNQHGSINDLPLECSKNEIKKLEGATYVFAVKTTADDDDIVYAFTTRGRQANNPDSDAKLQVLGPMRDKVVQERVFEVLDFMDNEDFVPKGSHGLRWQ